MKDTEEKKTIENVCKDYYKLINNAADLSENIDISTLTVKEVKKLKAKYQDYYNALIEIHFCISKFIYLERKDENADYSVDEDNSLTLTPKQIIIFSEKRANVIQFKYLYPLNIRLSEFAERRSKYRDIIIFALSIFFSTLLGLGITNLFDKNNDRDIQKIGNAITKMNDSLLFQLNQKDKIIDSLTMLQFKNNHIIDSLNNLEQKKCK